MKKDRVLQIQQGKMSETKNAQREENYDIKMNKVNTKITFANTYTHAIEFR